MNPKTRPLYMLSTRNPPQSKGYIQTESEGLEKDTWNDFDFFEFIKVRFMAQDVIYPGEGSVST